MITAKTDSEIQQDVLRELKWDTRVEETEIGVTVNKAVVTLTGIVGSYGKRMAAQEAAHRVAGVLDVANDLQVRIPDGLDHTDPEVAGVGLTEREAREQYGDDVVTGVFPWAANGRALMQNETVGWVKSIHEGRYGELLGIVMVGPHVTDLIEAGVVALDAEATVETVADGMAAHPTLSEAVKEAGLVALGRAIHLPPKRRVERAAAS